MGFVLSGREHRNCSLLKTNVYSNLTRYYPFDPDYCIFKVNTTQCVT